MPRDRLRSPRAGYGRKTTSLTDFEYRVWDQFQLSADDFGVMRFWPNKIMSENISISKRSPDDIQSALDRLISVGLAIVFDHQGDRFMCDPTWQDFQRIEYPHVTLNPKPSTVTLKLCSLATRKLFCRHPGGRQNDLRTISKRSPDSRAGASTYIPGANSKRLKATENIAELRATFEERFWPAYPRKVAKASALKAFVRLAPDVDLLATMLLALETQARSEQWRKDNGIYIPHAASWINGERWKDQVAAALPKPGSDEYYERSSEWMSECRRLHQGACGSASTHETRCYLDAQKS